MTIATLAALSLVFQAASAPTPQIDPKEWVSSHLIFVQDAKDSEALQKALALPESHQRTWMPSLAQTGKHRFESKVVSGTRFWISESLLGNRMLTAAERVLALAQKNGMSVRGRIGDFEREDQEAILSLLVNSPSFNGFGKLKAALNSPGAEIELYLSSEIRDQQGKTLTANQPEPNQIPKNSEDSKATPIPSAESRQIVMQSFPRMYDLDLIANTDVGMRLMEQMRRAKRKSFEEKISDLGIDSFKKQWLNPKGWDGKSSTTFSELDPASQDLIRKGLGHERTFTGTEKISPIRTNLIVSIAWQDGEFRRFSGASVMTALK